MKLLVTGAAGMLGFALFPILREQGHKVIATDTGEIIVEAILRKYFIVRAGWMIGGGEREKKFVALII